jgi:hypothetical protein
MCRSQLTLLLALLALLGAFCSAQDTSFAAGPQYLVTTGNPILLHSIATPSMSLDAPLPETPGLPEVGPPVVQQVYTSAYEPAMEPDLFSIYYGYPRISVIELRGEPARELPASVNDTGFVAITDSQAVRQMGYGETVGEAAAQWKIQRRKAPHVYTNADIQRLPKS